MRTVPKSRAGRLVYYQVHAHRWVEQAAEIGIAPERAAEVAALAAEAREAGAQQQLAISTARAATGRYNALLCKLGSKGGALLSAIQARAAHDESVYALAWVPRRRRRSRVLPPGKPYDLTTKLCATGALILRWKCRHPRGAEGTIYNIHRRLGHDGPLTYLNDVGKKTFTDATIPPGTPSVTYEIRAHRSTGRGATATFTVKFGGGMPATADQARRMAA